MPDPKPEHLLDLALLQGPAIAISQRVAGGSDLRRKMLGRVVWLMNVHVNQDVGADGAELSTPAVFCDGARDRRIRGVMPSL